MRILFSTVLGLVLATTAFAQDESKTRSEDGEKKPTAERTLATPFGEARIDTANTPKPAPKPSKIRPDLDVEMDGTSFKFIKKTPFGTNSWTRSESELSTQERAIVEQRGLLKVEEEPTDEAQVAAKQP